MNIKIEQLLQLRTLTHDGHLISSAACSHLQVAGLATRLFGWNFLTAKGVEYLVNLGIAESIPVQAPLAENSEEFQAMFRG